MEEWKWIRGFEGVYQISNYGRLKSFKKYGHGYILSNKNQKGGYLSVVLQDTIQKKKRYVRIHVLVAEAFIGRIPAGYQFIIRMIISKIIMLRILKLFIP